MICVQSLYKSYNNGKTEVLRSISLSIDEGEFAVILGASGSGKSTLMNVMSGLEKADKGEITVNGINLNALTDKQLTEFRKNYVGFVFQQYYLLPHLSVASNIKLGADLAKNDGFDEIIQALGLADKLNKRPSELSGGEQQRVCIARALAKKPRILFLDEPTGALDEKTGRDVLDCIIKQKEKLGFTMVMVTHNQNIAETAQKVILMNSGKIVDVSANKTQKNAYEIGW